MIAIYRITNTATGKAYIGLTSGSVRQRFSQHRAPCNTRGRRPLARAMRKHGLAAFVVETLYEAVDAAEAARVERAMIAQYGTMVPGGYNLTVGGEPGAGSKRSAEARANMSANGKGKHTPEGLARLSQLRRGSKMPPGFGDKVRARNAKGWTPAMRAAITAAQQTPEYRAKMRAAGAKARGKRKMTDELRAKLSAANKAAMTPEARQRLREANQRQFADPHARARHSTAMAAWRERRRQQHRGMEG